MERYQCTREGDIATLHAQVKSIFKDLNELKEVYNLIYGLTNNISILTEQMVQMNKEVTSIRKDVDVIKDKPINDFYHYKKLIIGGVITAIVGAYLTGRFM